MKRFEVRFRWDKNTNIRRWKVTGASEEEAQQTVEKVLKLASERGKVVSVRELPKKEMAKSA
jgi:hypothetical protein